MSQREEDIAFLEAQKQIEEEWAEFEAEYLAERTEDGNFDGISQNSEDQGTGSVAPTQ